MVHIRPYEQNDWPALWSMIKPVFRAGESYPYPSDITEQDTIKIWIETPAATYISIDEITGEITGTYYIKPNQPGRGRHICNCGYIVGETARGKGVAAALCLHSQQIAQEMNFRAMQFNLVVSTNEAAVALWQKLGFEIMATIPEAFEHNSKGYVDAHIMFKKLKSE